EETWIGPSASQVEELLSDGKARAYRASEGGFLLCLPLIDHAKPPVIAYGQMAGLAAQGGPGAERERVRLEKWLRAVSDRLPQAEPAGRRLDADGAAVQGATWEAILTLDHLIRRLRIHKEPTKNQQRILEGAFRML